MNGVHHVGSQQQNLRRLFPRRDRRGNERLLYASDDEVSVDHPNPRFGRSNGNPTVDSRSGSRVKARADAVSFVRDEPPRARIQRYVVAPESHAVIDVEQVNPLIDTPGRVSSCVGDTAARVKAGCLTPESLLVGLGPWPGRRTRLGKPATLGNAFCSIIRNRLAVPGNADSIRSWR
jgi:hypothetical protein